MLPITKSRTGGENEYVLPRGMTFRVDEIKRGVSLTADPKQKFDLAIVSIVPKR